MNKIAALNKLAALDRVGVYVLTKGDLAKAFPDEKEKAFEKSLQRLVSDGILQRVAKGVPGRNLTAPLPRLKSLQ